MPNGNPNRDDDNGSQRDDQTEHHGGGQSGYGSGRLGGDRTMGPAFRNQESGNRSNDDGQGVRTDDRFTGRGGEGYWLDRTERTDRSDDGNVGQPMPGGHRGKGPVGYTRSDNRIKESVSEALADDDHVDATHIEVVVKNGEVLLTGLVEDRWQSRRAEDLIVELPGVKDVQNQLRLRGNPNTDSAVGKLETETSTTDNKHRA